MLKYMLDTNICIFTIKNKPSVVREAFRQHYDRMCISSVTLMELSYGAEKPAMPEKNLRVVERLSQGLKCLRMALKLQHIPGKFGQSWLNSVHLLALMTAWSLLMPGHRG